MGPRLLGTITKRLGKLLQMMLRATLEESVQETILAFVQRINVDADVADLSQDQISVELMCYGAALLARVTELAGETWDATQNLLRPNSAAEKAYIKSVKHLVKNVETAPNALVAGATVYREL